MVRSAATAVHSIFPSFLGDFLIVRQYSATVQALNEGFQKQLEKSCWCLESACLLSYDLPFMVICLIRV